MTESEDAVQERVAIVAEGCKIEQRLAEWRIAQERGFPTFGALLRACRSRE